MPGQPVLRDFYLTIEAGQTVALVGHTGAGKSTLGKLIARFYEFPVGQILSTAGTSARSTLDSYRRQVGAVPQSPFLFSGTVADNIALPAAGATAREVEAVAAAVGGGDWVDALPDGLATPKWGARRGALHRPAAARRARPAAVAGPGDGHPGRGDRERRPAHRGPDPGRVGCCPQGTTAIVIAHRLSTIEHADRIIVLDHGRIVESGDHRSLLAAGGPYCAVYNAYFRHQSPDYQPGSGFVPVVAADATRA